MIELTILQHLEKALDVPVYLEEPDPAPDSFVLFEKTGSSHVNQLYSSTFAFQSYAKSMFGASEQNERTKAAVFSLISRPEIAAVRLNSDYNFTDTETKRYRYQAVYDIHHY